VEACNEPGASGEGENPRGSAIAEDRAEGGKQRLIGAPDFSGAQPGGVPKMVPRYPPMPTTIAAGVGQGRGHLGDAAAESQEEDGHDGERGQHAAKAACQQSEIPAEEIT